MPELKARLKVGDTVCGMMVSSYSCSVVESIGRAGFDFVMFDLEHSAVSLGEIENMSRAARLAGLQPFARVGENAPHAIGIALDRGLDGIMIPHITTKAEAEAAVRAAKFAPIGDRGLHTNIRPVGIHDESLAEFSQRQNEERLIGLLVEGREGIENLEEIARVEGFDMLFIGPYDLSQSMGVAGQVKSKPVLDAVHRTIHLCEEHGKAAGTFTVNTEDAQRWLSEGIRFLLYSDDKAIFFRACNDAAKAIKGRD